MPTTTLHALEYPDGTYAASSFFTPWQTLAEDCDATLIGKVDQQVFTASGTWTKPSGAKIVHVRVVGGGGAGGGAAATSSNVSLGGGGGGGGYAESWLAASACAATEAVTVGAGGTGVSGTTGNAGGTSSLGTLVVAAGGAGGPTMGAGSTAAVTGSALGGVGSTGQILVRGTSGPHMIRFSNTLGLSALGGCSVLGTGARGTTGAATGSDGSGYGGGGGGASNEGTVAAKLGGAGSDGIVIVTTLY